MESSRLVEADLSAGGLVIGDEDGDEEVERIGIIEWSTSSAGFLQVLYIEPSDVYLKREE